MIEKERGVGRENNRERREIEELKERTTEKKRE